MAIVDELLKEELTKAGVSEERQAPLMALAQMGVLMPRKDQIDKIISKEDMENAWNMTGLHPKQRLEIMQRVSSKAIRFLEKRRERDPWAT